MIGEKEKEKKERREKKRIGKWSEKQVYYSDCIDSVDLKVKTNVFSSPYVRNTF